jgi:hypothetical protein
MKRLLFGVPERDAVAPVAVDDRGIDECDVDDSFYQTQSGPAVGYLGAFRIEHERAVDGTKEGRSRVEVWRRGRNRRSCWRGLRLFERRYRIAT